MLQRRRAGIEHGIKLLLFEELFGTKATSAILIFKYRRVTGVKFNELNNLKDTMKRSKWISELALMAPAEDDLVSAGCSH